MKTPQPVLPYYTECQCLEWGGGSCGGINQYIGDGYCDDIKNNLACTYDGGDCCGSNVNTDYCNVCQCLEGGGGSSGGTTTPSGTTACEGINQYIVDGYYDDGVDYCGSNVNTEYILHRMQMPWMRGKVRIQYYNNIIWKMKRIMENHYWVDIILSSINHVFVIIKVLIT